MSLCILKLTGKDNDGNLQPYYILNPMNVVVNLGVVQRPGKITDMEDKPILFSKTKTFVFVGGNPLIVEETPEEIVKMLEADK